MKTLILLLNFFFHFTFSNTDKILNVVVLQNNTFPS